MVEERGTIGYILEALEKAVERFENIEGHIKAMKKEIKEIKQCKVLVREERITED